VILSVCLVAPGIALMSLPNMIQEYDRRQ
jgi:hypothetical protein